MLIATIETVKKRKVDDFITIICKLSYYGRPTTKKNQRKVLNTIKLFSCCIVKSSIFISNEVKQEFNCKE